MEITEPMTMATDYVLAAIALLCAVSLFRVGRLRQQTSVLIWTAALTGLAFAAIVGGTTHGFVHDLGTTMHAVLWKMAVYLAGITSFFMLLGAIVAYLPRVLHRWLLIAAGLKFLVYALWMIAHDSFRYVIYDYVPAMLCLLTLVVWSAYTREVKGAGWIIAGLLVLFVAAGVQQSEFALHKLFNHNDLYHVIQMGGVYLLYRGGRLLQDRV